MKFFFKHIITAVIISGFVSSLAMAQSIDGSSTEVTKTYTYTRVHFSIGRICSPIDVYHGIGNVPKYGFDFRAGFFVNENIRFSAEVARLTYSIEPVWKNVRFNSYEINLNYTGNLAQLNTEVYVLGGACVQQWTGLYTHVSDAYGFVNSSNKSSGFAGALNTGLGAEKKYKNLGVYGEFKLRVSKKNEALSGNFMDAIYSFGIKYDFKIKRERKDRTNIKANDKKTLSTDRKIFGISFHRFRNKIDVGPNK